MTNKKVWFFLIAGGGFLAGVHVFSQNFLPLEYVASQAPRPLPLRHLKTPEIVRGIYMSSWVAGTPGLRNSLIAFIEAGEINSVVIDAKDYTGKVSFEVRDEKLKEAGYGENRIPDIREFIKELHNKNIYAIARIAVFQDPQLAKVRPDLAVKRKNGKVWKDKKGLSWIDPASREAWDFIIKVAKEAESVGFDELQFDYIRFPSDGNLEDMKYPFWDEKTPRSEIIKSFFAYLDRELEILKVPLSVDIFGLTTWNTDDLNIGQILENALPYFDFVSPMVYPSHYPAGFQGYKNPAEHPYEIIRTALERARERIISAGEKPEKLRPWLQDFDLGANYDTSLVKLEKQAVYDAGLSSWLFWDPANKYTRDAYNFEKSYTE